MLRLRRVTFFIRDSMFVIAPLDQLLAQSLDVPKPLAIRSEPLNDTLVGGAIPVQDRVGSRLSSQPLTNPVEMVLLVPQQGAESPARRVGQTASGQFVREMTMNAVLEDVREREHFGDGSRRGDLVEVERLVAPTNPHARETEGFQRVHPEPGVPRFVGAVPGEPTEKVRIRCVADYPAKHQRAVELALPIPVQSPVEATLFRHGCPPTPPSAGSRRSAGGSSG